MGTWGVEPSTAVPRYELGYHRPEAELRSYSRSMVFCGNSGVQQPSSLFYDDCLAGIHGCIRFSNFGSLVFIIASEAQ